MIVLILVAIVSAVAIPALNSSLNEMKLDGAAREVVSALRYVQSLSIKEGALYGVQVDVNNDKFRCYENIPGNVILHPVEKKPFEVNFTGAGHLQGVDIISTTFLTNKVTFNDLGEPSDSGSVILGYGGLQKTVNVTAPIGKVTVN